MVQFLSEILVILVLLMLNGVFAMTEIAFISVKRGRLQNLAEQGNRKAVRALELADSPNRFLSTIQIGITLIGIVAGAFGGATVAEKLALGLQTIPWLASYAQAIAFFIVVVAITYFSLLIGELVPKRFGMHYSEGIALHMANPMLKLSRLAGPLVAFLSLSTDTLLRLSGFRPKLTGAVSEDEVKVLMEEGLRAGAFSLTETHIVHSALELDQHSVRDIMTPRPKIIWLNVQDDHKDVWHKIVASGHTHFPLYERNRDNIVGIVSLKAIYANLAANVGVRLRDLVTRPLIVPSSQNAVTLLETFKHSGKHIALVTDEFGSIVGLVTLHDVMEAVLGDFPSQQERQQPEIKKRDNRTWLVDGMIEIEKLEQTIPELQFAQDENRDYQTLAGYVVKQLGHIPKEGEVLDEQGFLFEVLDMDRHRIDKILLVEKSAKRPAPHKQSEEEDS